MEGKKVLIQTQDWHYRCGDGCCDEYGTNVFVNGKEMKTDGDYANPIDLAIEILESLGYEVVEEELEFQDFDCYIEE